MIIACMVVPLLSSVRLFTRPDNQSVITPDSTFLNITSSVQAYPPPETLANSMASLSR